MPKKKGNKEDPHFWQTKLFRDQQKHWYRILENDSSFKDGFHDLELWRAPKEDWSGEDLPPLEGPGGDWSPDRTMFSGMHRQRAEYYNEIIRFIEEATFPSPAVKEVYLAYASGKTPSQIFRERMATCHIPKCGRPLRKTNRSGFCQHHKHLRKNAELVTLEAVKHAIFRQNHKMRQSLIAKGGKVQKAPLVGDDPDLLRYLEVTREFDRASRAPPKDTKAPSADEQDKDDE